MNLKMEKDVTRAHLPSLKKTETLALTSHAVSSFISKSVSLTEILVWGGTYLIRTGTQEMSGVLEVKGEATLASVSDREIPA